MYIAQIRSVIIKLVIHIFVNNPKSLVVDMRMLGVAENSERNRRAWRAKQQKQTREQMNNLIMLPTLSRFRINNKISKQRKELVPYPLCISNISPRLFPKSSTTAPMYSSGTSTVAIFIAFNKRKKCCYTKTGIAVFSRLSK
jgi:hypothetical protein